MKYFIILFLVVLSSKLFADHENEGNKSLFKCELKIPQEGFLIMTKKIRGLNFKKQLEEFHNEVEQYNQNAKKIDYFVGVNKNNLMVWFSHHKTKKTIEPKLEKKLLESGDDSPNFKEKSVEIQTSSLLRNDENYLIGGGLIKKNKYVEFSNIIINKKIETNNFVYVNVMRDKNMSINERAYGTVLGDCEKYK